MKKKLVSLALALVLSLSLSIPASAAFHDLTIITPDGETINDTSSGDGWTYQGDVLTLNGTKDLDIFIGASPTIVLAPGSKNTLTALTGGDSEEVNDITIKGSGELIIYNPNPDEFTRKCGVFSGLITSLKLEDGLTVTGGLKQGDTDTLELKEVYTDPVNGFKTIGYATGDKPAMYVRIAPAAGASAPSTSAGFSDVAANSPFAAAIRWAVDQKITNGKTPTTFGPGDTCTVSHILTFLYRAGNGAGTGNERDKVVSWAESLGIDTGNLNAPCTRAMAVDFMWKAAGSPAPSRTTAFADVPASADYAKAVSWAVEKGITNGTGGDAFSPNGTCTRGQIVTFLYRAK